MINALRIPVALAMSMALSSHAIALQLPSVDLGYQIYRANSLNVSGSYYNFSNIRYAQPPLGDLRFAEPQAPRGRNSSVDDGNVGRICPQGVPAWLQIGGPFLAAYTKGQPFNFTAANDTAAEESGTMTPPPQDPRTTEDCLFLDVIVPKLTFDSVTKKNTSQSPVLVWIYGGGYCTGDKTSYGNGAGLVKASLTADSSGTIVVLLNYRLGAFGWLAGPTFQSNGTANAGLYDQRLALEWVQNNIHFFGGDRTRVTVMGESAGGGSIMHQITAFGGTKGPAPFDRAIIQSPAYITDLPVQQQEDTLQKFLRILNVSTIQQARDVSSESLISANAKFVGESPYGNFIIDPVVDGTFVPATPGQLLLQGSFDQRVKVMNGHQSDEGPIFTAPYVNDNASFTLFVQGLVPSANTQDIYYITNTLYPAVFDGTLPYGDQLSRAILFVSEYIITCKTNMLDRAFNNDTYGYVFSVPPGVHAQDTQYTFYNGPGTSDEYGTYNASVALALQQYITTFAITGTPNGGPAFPAFPLYGSGTILNLTTSGFPSVPDPTANERCLYWQQEPYKTDTASGTTKPATNDSSTFWGGDIWKTIGTLLASLLVL